MSDKTYLGDGVYAESERGMIRLTTSNGYSDTNEIFLEPEVYASLVKWVEAKTRGQAVDKPIG